MEAVQRDTSVALAEAMKDYLETLRLEEVNEVFGAKRAEVVGHEQQHQQRKRSRRAAAISPDQRRVSGSKTAERG